MGRFKIGDRVRGIDATDWTFGLTGTVFQDDGPGCGQFAVEFDGSHTNGWKKTDNHEASNCWWMSGDDLTLVSENAPAAQDPEVAAIAACVEALKPLGPAQRRAVILYINERKF